MVFVETRCNDDTVMYVGTSPPLKNMVKTK